MRYYLQNGGVCDVCYTTNTTHGNNSKIAYWTDEHRCSNCGEECFVTVENARQHYEYDWNEKLVPCGIDYDYRYNETPYCPYCGAKMQEN